MALIPIEARIVNLEELDQVKRVETVLRGQRIEQITDHLIVRQSQRKQRMDNGEMASPLPYYGKILPLITRGGPELYEVRTQSTLPDFNLVSLPQYRSLRRESIRGVFSLGPGFDEEIEVINLLLLQLFADQTDFVETIRALVRENFEKTAESPAKIFGKNQYLFSARTIK